MVLALRNMYMGWFIRERERESENKKEEKLK